MVDYLVSEVGWLAIEYDGLAGEIDLFESLNRFLKYIKRITSSFTIIRRKTTDNKVNNIGI